MTASVLVWRPPEDSRISNIDKFRIIESKQFPESVFLLLRWPGYDGFPFRHSLVEVTDVGWICAGTYACAAAPSSDLLTHSPHDVVYRKVLRFKCRTAGVDLDASVVRRLHDFTPERIPKLWVKAARVMVDTLIAGGTQAVPTKCGWPTFATVNTNARSRH